MSPAPKCSPEQQLQHVLESAVACIEESSLLDFTMSAIAKKAGISIGSLYKHVQSKEDVLLALATQMYQHERRQFGKALALNLSPAEQLIAVSLRNPNLTRCFSFAEHLNSLVSCLPILQRGSHNWLNQMALASRNIKDLFSQQLDNAIDHGELLMDKNETEELGTGCWALCVGFDQVMLHQHIFNPENYQKPLPYPLGIDSNHIKNLMRLLNSYPWKTPLDKAALVRAEQAVIRAGLR